MQVEQAQTNFGDFPCRYCYNQRSINAKDRRITWAIFGVATPSDLITHKNRTPFNIGRALELYGLNCWEAEPLVKGLEEITAGAEIILKEILNWTSGQPFITQKICQLVVKLAKYTTKGELTVPPGTEGFGWKSFLWETTIPSARERNSAPVRSRKRARLAQFGRRQKAKSKRLKKNKGKEQFTRSRSPIRLLYFPFAQNSAYLKLRAAFCYGIAISFPA